jgi:sulfite reductase (NADPH) flavoprotein alpha-component
MRTKGDIDCVITSREFVEAIKLFGLDWQNTKPGQFDEPFTAHSQTSSISVTIGGWTDAVLRAAYAKKTNAKPQIFDKFKEDDSHIKYGEFDIAGTTVKVAVCDGLGLGNQFLASGDLADVHLIEILACPGGCLFGGGQIRVPSRRSISRRVQSLREVAGQSEYSSAIETVPLIEKALGAAYTPEVEKEFATAFEPQESVTRSDCSSGKRSESGMIIVAYGSTNGRATRYARLVSTFVHSPSRSMNSLTIRQLLSRKTAIFITSTHGDGEFPANAVKFVKQLRETTEDLSEVQFSVLALGQRSAGDNFCKAGLTLAALLEEKGARPIIPVSKADSLDTHGGDDTYSIWSKDLATALYVKKPKFGLDSINHLEVTTDNSLLEKPSRPTGFEYATMVESCVITPEGYVPAMHKYILELPDGMTYEPGDHVCILGSNDKVIVDSVLEALKLDATALFQIQSPDPIIPQKVSVRQLFTQYLNLNALPPRGLLIGFLAVADDEGKERLSPLTNELDTKLYKQYCEDVNVAEFILEFSKYGIPPLEVLVSTIPHITGRFYSVASAPDARRGFLELMCLDCVFGKNGQRYGLTTHFLATPGLQKVPIYCERGQFKYPADTTTPLILVALGSGVVPMFALLQFRQMTTKPLGPCYVFFGAKYQRAYPLLLKKMANFYESKVITKIWTAFSRDGDKREHVQDVMTKASSDLWDLWQDSRTQFYYCGPKRGVAESLKTLMLKITINEGYLSMEEAMAYNSRHEWVVEDV